MAELIRAALEEDGVSQATFCRLAGVSQKHLSQVLLGKAMAPPATFDYWAFLLGRHFEITLEPGHALGSHKSTRLDQT